MACQHIGMPQPGTLSHSLWETDGSYGFLWDIFYMRINLPATPCTGLGLLLARIKQSPSPQPKNAFLLFNFSKAFYRCLLASQREASGCFYLPAELCFQRGTCPVCPTFGQLGTLQRGQRLPNLASARRLWQQVQSLYPSYAEIASIGQQGLGKDEDADSYLLLLHPAGL